MYAAVTRVDDLQSIGRGLRRQAGRPERAPRLPLHHPPQGASSLSEHLTLSPVIDDTAHLSPTPPQACGDEWFQKAHAAEPSARHPLLLWNCSPRAGASQFHGHAQVMLNFAPLPDEVTLAESALARAGEGGAGVGSALLGDFTEAHRALGCAAVFPELRRFLPCLRPAPPQLYSSAAGVSKSLTGSTSRLAGWHTMSALAVPRPLCSPRSPLGRRALFRSCMHQAEGALAVGESN